MSTSRIRLSAYLILLISLIISVRLVKDILKLRQVDDRVRVAQDELNVAQKEQLKLKQDLNRVNSSEWQEEQFRNTLNMAKPNEVVVVVPEEISQIQLLSADQATASADLKTWQKWWQLFAF